MFVGAATATAICFRNSTSATLNSENAELLMKSEYTKRAYEQEFTHQDFKFQAMNQFSHGQGSLGSK